MCWLSMPDGRQKVISGLGKGCGVWVDLVPALVQRLPLGRDFGAGQFVDSGP
jgi:hypothetical protein